MSLDRNVLAKFRKGRFAQLDEMVPTRCKST